MSYEDALEAMRNREVDPPTFEHVKARHEQRTPLPRRSSSVARVATIFAGLGFVLLFVRPTLMAGSFVKYGMVQLQVAALLPASVLFLALRWAKEEKLGPQLLCRAAWWSSLVVGVLASLNYSETFDKSVGAWIAISCAVALRSVGETGLDVREPDHPFAPVRFRGHLLLALVMAAADALTLGFSALMQLRVGSMGWTLMGTATYAGPTVLAAVVMAVAVWGVYHLRTWALLLNLVANIAIAYFAMEGTLNLSPSVSLSLATTAAIQSFIPVPILAVALGDRNAGKPLLAGVRQWLMTIAVYGLAAFSIIAVPSSARQGWVDGPGRAFIRGTGLGRRVHTGVVQERLQKEGELRGLDLSSTPIVLRGADLRGANLEGTSLARAKLRDVDLRDANLRRVHFGVSSREAVFENVQLAGADMTGALTTEAFWEGIDPGNLAGVRCPDGSMADPQAGCEGRLGHFDRDYRPVFEPGPGCETVRHFQRDRLHASTGGIRGPLLVGPSLFVRVGETMLVADDAIIRIDPDGRWHWKGVDPIGYRRAELDHEFRTCEVTLTPIERDG